MKYTLIRSRRRRRSLSLRVADSGEIIVRAPAFTPKLFVDHFVRSKTEWIKNQLAQRRTSLAPLKTYFSDSELKSHIKHEITRFSSLLKLSPSRIIFTKVKSYWGNCAPDGTLRFNLQLRLASPEAVTYVVVHELAHLKHRGHGKRFWSLVTNTFPSSNDMRRELRQLSRDQRTANHSL